MANAAKREGYKRLFELLNKAMRMGFYYEAIFLEYAILEDRTTSMLKHANIPYKDSKGDDYSVGRKINLLNSRKELSRPFIKRRLSKDFLDATRAWTKERNDLVHHLADIKFDDQRVKDAAMTGREIVSQMRNKARSINRYLDSLS